MTAIDNVAQRMEPLLQAVHETYGDAFEEKSKLPNGTPDLSDPMVYAKHYAKLIDDDWYNKRIYKRVVTYISTLSMIEEQFYHLEPEEHYQLKLFVGAYHAMGNSLERLEYPNELVLTCYEKAMVMAKDFYCKDEELGWKLLLNSSRYLSHWYLVYGDPEVSVGLMADMLDLYDKHFTEPEMEWLSREYSELHADLKKLLIQLDDVPALKAIATRSHPLVDSSMLS